MAVNLKLKKKCHIVAPDWLNVGVCFESVSVNDGIMCAARVSARKADTRDYPARIQ
jgi:hypothetical protein